MAQTLQSLDFSGTRTAIMSNGSTVGYTFSNIFGDGSDALLDVRVNHTNTSSHLGSTVTDVLSPVSYPSIVITSGTSQWASSGSSDSSLGIALAYQFTASSVELGLHQAEINFFLHNAAGNAISGKYFNFITRDLDGNSNPSVGTKVTEGINTGPTSTAHNRLDSSFVSLTGQTIQSNEYINILDPTTDLRGTVSWNQVIGSNGRWTWKPFIEVDQWDSTSTSGRTSRGFIFDAGLQPLPEPSSILLLGLASLGFIVRRRR